MIDFGFGRSRRTVGIDLGSGLVKAAVVDHSGDLPRLVTVAYRPVRADATTDGDIAEPRHVLESLRGLLSDHAIEPRNVVVSVGGRDVIIKRIRMDRMSREDARGVIRWEAEQHVPFDMENVQLDFEITDPEGEGLEMSVLLVAAKRELVESRVELLRDEGIEPAIVDVDAFALHNALEYNHPEAMDGVAGLVSIGHELTHVNILEDGIPVLSRDLPFGTRRLRERLQEEHDLTAERAEALLRGEGGVGAVESLSADLSGEIARGVERTALFLEARDEFTSGYDLNLGRVYVCGGGVGVPGLVDSLARRLDVETARANPLARLDVIPGGLEHAGAEVAPSIVMQAVGLGLRKVA